MLRRLRMRVFHLWFVLTRPMTLGVRALIYDPQGKAVFLIRHTYVPGWQLPGGGVEAAETALEALRREIMEECNIEIIGRPLLKSMHFNRQASRRDHVALYLVTTFKLLGPRPADHEIAEARFFALDALPPEVTPATRRRIAEILGGVEPSEDW
ncbi:NUDIX domain-containing protein [Tianweitania sediminis]|uniref:NUDIX domain-containing protein n=1 Tax=Tianweitania sediminis TaxID=1502156 RepID=A0A8J7UIX3_9HYPH|nr:NUDIX domain-containing protein [Tianweitania sediminis]MBP0439383.1 NUDIX domain-containing protein [Tianweitania sediminis]